MYTTLENILNVSILEPREKHPTVFKHLDQLKQGEFFIFQNDHDPKPLYYQLLGERGNIFKWEYLEQGPERWMIRISKRYENEPDLTLGQIVAKDLRKAQLFKKYDMDFCCGGHKTLKEVCDEKGLDIIRIESELLQAEVNPYVPAFPYNEWSLDFLIDFIINTHHMYIRKVLPELMASCEKVCHKHGEHHPELKSLLIILQEIDAELKPHMMKEERVLFPLIKQLVASKNNKTPLPESTLETIQHPIHNMETEHELVGKYLEEIRSITRSYTLPEDACNSYKFLFNLLQEFETDLHIHIHLENNILFPKAMEIERQLVL